MEPELIKKSKILLYVCTLNLSNAKLTTTKLNPRSVGSIRNFLLATSAIPGIFKHEKIGTNHHLDGGLVPFLNNNHPFEVLIEKVKCKEIMNVFLTAKPDLKEQENYPKVKFINIFPTVDFKGITPSLNFSPEIAKKLIKRGYDDTRKVMPIDSI